MMSRSSHYQELTLKARLARGKLQPLFSAHAQAHDASWCLELWGRPAVATLLGVATLFTELVGCDLPVQLSAQGGVGTVEPAAAVAAAGGCGMVPAMADGVQEGCGVNYLMPFVPHVDAVRESARRARVVEFLYGNPRVDRVPAVPPGGARTGRMAAAAGWN